MTRTPFLQIEQHPAFDLEKCRVSIKINYSPIDPRPYTVVVTVTFGDLTWDQVREKDENYFEAMNNAIEGVLVKMDERVVS